MFYYYISSLLMLMFAVGICALLTERAPYRFVFSLVFGISALAAILIALGKLFGDPVL
jgi:multisubunit Na+/H+ antiporter MnhC subunit